jgi:hypothetical protein
MRPTTKEILIGTISAAVGIGLLIWMQFIG